MEYVIDFDISALAILTIMIFSTCYRHMVSSRAEKCFMVLMAVTFASAVLDIICVALAPNLTGVYLACALYYVVRTAVAPVYFMYLVALTDGWKIFRKIYANILFKAIYAIMVIAVVIVNPINHCIFKIEPNGTSTQGPCIWVLYTGVLLYFIASAVYLFKYRNFYARNKFYCLITIVPASFLAVLLQYFCPNILIECFVQTVCLLFYSITLQSPEERTTAEFNVNSREAFFEDMRLSEFNEKEHTLILFKVKNYAARIEAVSYEAGTKITGAIVERVFDLLKREGLTAVPYHFGVGAFGILFSGDERKEADNFAQKLSLALSDNRLSKNAANAKIEFYECIVDLPDDISGYSSIQMMLEEYQNFLPSTDAIYRIKDVPGYKDFTMYNKLDGIISDAIANDKIEVFYMPIYSVEEKRFASAEALLRLHNQEYGYINPEKLVDFAEETGDIHKIGRVIFEKVCEFVSTPEFTATGLDFVEVNLSVEQFHDRHLCEKMLLIAERYNVDPSVINFEITETGSWDIWNEVVNQVKIMTDAGFSFSIDDYGQKNSNLKRLSEIPVELVKLDKSLADDYSSPSGQVILKNTIKMVKALGLSIAAEGIENQRMADRFSALGCDYLQGYAFSKALPREEFINYMKEVQA
ncbi:MAG: EAL domain-containing protein [Firmicutes bacterium]|nr:EAL domain-containing protein [Bacillota bacterium]